VEEREGKEEGLSVSPRPLQRDRPWSEDNIYNNNERKKRLAKLAG